MSLALLKMVKWGLLLLLFILGYWAGNVECGDEEDKMELNAPLYSGNDVNELLSLCKDVTLGRSDDDDDDEEEEEEGDDDDDDESSVSYTCLPEGCMEDCNKHRLERLRDAQNRTSDLLNHLDDFLNNVFWNLLVFAIVLLQGLYLIFKQHFKWRTLPVIGNQFEEDPTDGYRYSHYMWMRWVTLDSNNPNYQRGMSDETKVVKYTPQIKEWSDPDADSVVDLHPAWSIHDVYDMTPDPHERLRIYFRMIQEHDATYINPKKNKPTPNQGR